MILIEELYQLLNTYSEHYYKLIMTQKETVFHLNEDYRLVFYTYMRYEIWDKYHGWTPINSISNFQQFYHLFTEEAILKIEEGLIKLL